MLETEYFRKVINAVNIYMSYERINGPLGVHGEAARQELEELLLISSNSSPLFLKVQP